MSALFESGAWATAGGPAKNRTSHRQCSCRGDTGMIYGLTNGGFGGIIYGFYRDLLGF